MTPRVRNQTTINPQDKKTGNYEGQPKLNWRSYKSSDNSIPSDIKTFVEEVLVELGETFFPNVGFKNLKSLRWAFYLPVRNAVIDFLQHKETPKEKEELIERRYFCKKMGIKRIVISKFSYKNLRDKLDD